LFDTADMYNNENEIGDALKEGWCKDLNELVVQSKLLPSS
jgi:diketogulonate reductase-like aldo/keto reductase